MYDALAIDDRVQRFFGAYHPGPAFFTELATVDTAHGARVVAVLGPATDDLIVGEAGYTLLPNGNGELGIAVAHDWRDRLAPMLLDALLAHAAEVGVPGLEADVLTANRSLLALLRARGATVIERGRWRTVRLLVPSPQK
jgi:hypothetical protein